MLKQVQLHQLGQKRQEIIRLQRLKQDEEEIAREANHVIYPTVGLVLSPFNLHKYTDPWYLISSPIMFHLIDTYVY